MAKGMNFSSALMALQAGERVARKGWNGKGMWLVWMTGLSGNFQIHSPMSYVPGKPAGFDDRVWTYSVKYPPHAAMKTADDTFVPWLCSVTDMAADDWEVVR